MRVEATLTHGLICISTYVDLYFQRPTNQTLKEILVSEDFALPTNTHFIPFDKFWDSAKAAVKVLKGLNTHPPDAMVAGFLVDQSQPIVFAVARTERKQQDIMDGGLAADTESERTMLQAAAIRMRPLLQQMRTGTAVAESVMAAITAEDDPKVARARLVAFAEATSTVRDDQEILSHPSAIACSKKFPASKPHALSVKVTGLEESPATASLLLVKEELPGSLFLKTDIGIRTITATVTDPHDFFLLNLCMAYKLPILAELAVTLDIGRSGRTYTASFVRFVDLKSVWDAVHAASRNQSDDLFGTQR